MEFVQYIHNLDSVTEFSRNESLNGTLKSGSTERKPKVSFRQGNNLLVPEVNSPTQRRRSFTDFVRKLSPIPPMRKTNVREFLNSIIFYWICQ